MTGRQSRQFSSVAQWQSIRLLTGGLLVRVQPEEPAPKQLQINNLQIEPNRSIELTQDKLLL